MNISFVKLSPTGNTTVLVKDRVDRAAYRAVARELLREDSVGGEQVGFLTEPNDPGCNARLEMMGGEFCGNATMSVGALLAREQGLRQGETAEYLLEVSGTTGPVACRITYEENSYKGTVAMPLPCAIYTCKNETRVDFDGITHIILPQAGLSDDTKTMVYARERCEALGVDALGVMGWDEEAGFLRPLVYVAEVGSCIWEHGCGSGTSAVGCALAMSTKATVTREIRQPGGTILVTAGYGDSRITDLSITGSVRITAEGTAYIP